MKAKQSPRRLGTGNGPGSKLHCNHTRPADLLLPRLDGLRATGTHSWIAKCPVHDDRTPSLSIKQVDDRLLVHCFGGCAPGDVLAAVGLSLSDLFDRPSAQGKPPLPPSQRRRHGQAADALRALLHEVRIVKSLADQVHAGFALDPNDEARLGLALTRIRNAEAIAQ